LCAHKDSLRAQTRGLPAAPQGGPWRRGYGHRNPRMLLTLRRSRKRKGVSIERLMQVACGPRNDSGCQHHAKP
jgi:hypothetical protein